MPKLNVERLEKKFMSLTKSRDSIQCLSGWILAHKHACIEISEEWLKAIKRSEMPHRLTLFYLANDVLQHCKKKNASEYKSSFANVLEEAVLLTRDKSIKREILRMIGIWRERAVYQEEFLRSLENSVREDDSIDSSSHISQNSFDFGDDDYFPSVDELVDTAEIEREKQQKEEQESNVADFNVKYFFSCMKRLDTTRDAFSKAYKAASDLKYRIPNMKDLSDPDAAAVASQNNDAACEVVVDLIETGHKTLAAGKKAMKQLEICQLCYSDLDEAAKKVAAAYKIYSKKLVNMRAKTAEKMASFPDSTSSHPPFLSPSSDASQCQSPTSPEYSIPFISHPAVVKAEAHSTSHAGTALSESRLSLDKRLSLMLNSGNSCLLPAFVSAVADFKEAKPESSKTHHMKSPLVSSPPLRSPSGSFFPKKQPVKRKIEPLSPPILSEKLIPTVEEDTSSKEMLNAIIELANDPINSEELEIKKPKISDVLMNFSEAKIQKLKSSEQTPNGLEPPKKMVNTDSKKETPVCKSIELEPSPICGEVAEEKPVFTIASPTDDPDIKIEMYTKSVDIPVSKPKNDKEQTIKDSKTAEIKTENLKELEKIIPLDVKKSERKMDNSLLANKPRLSSDVSKSHTVSGTKSKDLDAESKKISPVNKVNTDQKNNKDAALVHKSKNSEHKTKKDSLQKVKSVEQSSSHSNISDQTKTQKQVQNLVKRDDHKSKSSNKIFKKDYHKKIENKDQKLRKDSSSADQISIKDSGESKKMNDSASTSKKDYSATSEKAKLAKSPSGSSLTSKSSSSEVHRSSGDSHSKSSHHVSSTSGKSMKTSSSKSHSGTVKTSSSSHGKDQSVKTIDNTVKETEKQSSSTESSDHKIGSSSSHPPAVPKIHKEEERKHHKSSSSDHKADHGEKKHKPVIKLNLKSDLTRAKGSQKEMLKKIEKTPLIVLEKLKGNYPVCKEHFNSPRNAAESIATTSTESLETKNLSDSMLLEPGESAEKIFSSETQSGEQKNVSGEVEQVPMDNDPQSHDADGSSEKSPEEPSAVNRQTKELLVPSLSAIAKNKIDRTDTDDSRMRGGPTNLDKKGTDEFIVSPLGYENLDLAEVVEIDTLDSAVSKTMAKDPAVPAKSQNNSAAAPDSKIGGRSKRVIHTRARTREEFVSKHNFMVCLLESLKLLNNITSRAKPVYVQQRPRKKCYPDAIPLKTVREILNRHDKKTCLLSSLMGTRKEDREDFKCVTQVAQQNSSDAPTGGGCKESDDAAVPSASSSILTEEKSSNLDHVDMEIDSEGED